MRRRTGTRWHVMIWPVVCWVFVLTAIAVVQVVRAQWFDAAVFFLASAAVSSDAVFQPRIAVRHRLRLRRLVEVAALVGVIIAVVPRHGVLIRILVILVGVATVTVGWSGMAVRDPGSMVVFSPGMRRLALAWALIMIAGCIWELFQFLMDEAWPHGGWFSLSDLLNPFLGVWPGKMVFAVAWLGCGVWLIRRGGRRPEP